MDNSRSYTTLLRVGRIVALVWSGIWVWRGLMAGLGVDGGITRTLFHALIPGGLFLACALITLRDALLGGGMLLFCALAAIFWFKMDLHLFVMLPLPAILSGGIIFWVGWTDRNVYPTKKRTDRNVHPTKKRTDRNVHPTNQGTDKNVHPTNQGTDKNVYPTNQGTDKNVHPTNQGTDKNVYPTDPEQEHKHAKLSPAAEPAPQGKPPEMPSV